MAEMWKKRNLAEKMFLIALLVHFLGFFLIPMAELSASAKTMARLASAFGMDEVPKNMTRLAYLRITMQDSPGLAFFTFGIFPVVDALCLLLAVKRGRKRYIAFLLIYLLMDGWSSVTVQIATDTTGYEMCFGSVVLILLPLLLAALSLVCFITYGRRRAQTAESGSRGVRMGDVEKGAAGKLGAIKNQHWGGRAETAKAVASYAGKRAADLAQKVADGGRELVRQAKEEQAGKGQAGESGAPARSGENAGKTQSRPAQSQSRAAQPQSRPERSQANPAPAQQSRPPRSGKLTGCRGMYAGAQIPLENGERILIGRDAGRSSLVLADKMVSGVHCMVSYDAESGKYLVADCSENGTTLENGMRLPKNRTVSLDAGNVLQIGSEQFRLG